MANFLFIDTSSMVATVAISKNEEIVACERSSDQHQQAAVINILIEKVLKSANWDISSVDCFCVCAGPGSYTGLRVGMSTVKGMAFALDKPMICFDRMQLLALSIQPQNINQKETGVLLLARKGEFFWALFDQNGKELVNPKHIFDTELESVLRPEYLILTDVAELSVKNEVIQMTKEYSPDILEWIKLAQLKWQQQAFDDIAYAEPYYLKAAFTTNPKKMI